MSVFSIQDTDGNHWMLSATTDIRINKPSKVTSHPVVRGEDAVDNIVNSNVTITFDGVITDIQTIVVDTQDGSEFIQQGAGSTGLSSRSTLVREFVTNIDRIRESKQLVTVFYDSNLEAFRDCAITSFELSKDFTVANGYRVTLMFEQVRLISPATVTISRDDQTEPDVTQSRTNSGGSNTEEIPSRSLFGSGVISINDALAPATTNPTQGGT